MNQIWGARVALWTRESKQDDRNAFYSGLYAFLSYLSISREDQRAEIRCIVFSLFTSVSVEDEAPHIPTLDSSLF
jgi:hypothetical protein